MAARTTFADFDFADATPMAGQVTPMSFAQLTVCKSVIDQVIGQETPMNRTSATTPNGMTVPFRFNGEVAMMPTMMAPPPSPVAFFRHNVQTPTGMNGIVMAVSPRAGLASPMAAPSPMNFGSRLSPVPCGMPMQMQPMTPVRLVRAPPAFQMPSITECKTEQKQEQVPEQQPVTRQRRNSIKPLPPSHSDKQTTVIIRNIPNKCTQRMILNVLRQEGFAGCFDLVFMPMDNTNGCNLGYVFVNFIDEDFANEAKKVFVGKKLTTSKSNKCMAVEFAKMQGYTAWLEQISNIAALQEDGCPPEAQPLLFDTDKMCEIPFPSKENLAAVGVPSIADAAKEDKKPKAEAPTERYFPSVEELDLLLNNLQKFQKNTEFKKTSLRTESASTNASGSLGLSSDESIFA